MRRLWLTLLLMLASPALSQTLVASVEPLAKVLRGLYGDQVEVVTLLQANQNPHQLALSPRQAMLVQQADLLVWLGEAVEAPLAVAVGCSPRTPPVSALSGWAGAPPPRYSPDGDARLGDGSRVLFSFSLSPPLSIPPLPS